nr:WcbI family polysaccharide biosynthesis putative acetyltransferase [Kineosporia rhizophila]
MVVLHGNCQAESLRVLLSAPDSPVRTVRIPPVHELTGDDLPYLHKLLGQADGVVSQPVRSGYRGLPIGTADVLAAAAPATRLVLVPVIRWAALHPFQVIVRSAAGEPPIVPYHDLRTMALAIDVKAPPVGEDFVRAVRDISVRELRERQHRHGTIDVVDLLVEAGRQACQVVNHPGNPVLRGAAERIALALGQTWESQDPGRVLLNSVHAPVSPLVVDALGLDGAPTPDWLVHGRTVTDDEVREAHLDWYRRNPGVASDGLERHAEVARLLLG